MDITAEKPAMTPAAKTALLIFNSFVLAIGNCGGPQMARLYFNNGGHRIWFSSWLQTAAWPITFIPLLFSYIHRRRRASAVKPSFIQIKPPLFLSAAAVGILSGLDNYFYAYGLKYLPVSTAALIVATQLGFTAVFAYFMVKQKFTAYSINAVVLLTFGAGILAMHTNGDLPAGESSRQYTMGFVMMIATSLLYGLILPLMELSYKKGKQEIGYTVVLEFQMVMCFFATAVTTVGMLINNDFKVIPTEARASQLGEAKYYIVIALTAIIWQGFFLGVAGVIYCASSLVSGILITLLLPVTEILAVIFFREKFQAEKGVSLALSLWGFISYFYGEAQSTKAKTEDPVNDRTVPLQHRQIES